MEAVVTWRPVISTWSSVDCLTSGSRTKSCLAVFCSGCWGGWPSVAVPKLRNRETEIVVTDEEISWVVSLLDIGNAISPLPMCYLADILGMKFVLSVSGVTFFMASTITFFANVPEMLYVARLLAGLGKRIAYAIIPVYLGEIASVRIRGAVSFMFAISLWLGTMFVFATGPFISFKMLAVLTGIFSLAFFAAFSFCPESPYFLLKRNREEAAYKALSWLRNANIQNNDQDYELIEREIREIKISIREEMETNVRFYDLFSTGGNRRATLIVLILAALQRLSGISPLLSYSSITLPRNEVFGPDEGAILFGLFLAVCSIPASFLVDRLGRRFLLIISSFGCFLCSAVAAAFYYTYLETVINVDSYIWVPYLSLIGYAFSYAFGLGNIPNTLLGELFTTNVKNFAAALTAIVFALGSFLVQKLYITIDGSVGVYFNYTFFAISSLVGTVFAYFEVFETKGRTFNEIQCILNGRERILDK